jgi:hypothetical protein
MWLVAFIGKINRAQFFLWKYLRISIPNLRFFFSGMQEPAETGSCTGRKDV